MNMLVPDPESPLARYRVLSPSAGVKVSPLCFGAMNLGTAWESFLGPCDKDTSFSMLDYFYEQGGNFIDTASNYQDQQSETWIGEWMEKRQNRDQMVIATKYTTFFKRNEKLAQTPSYVGNSAKSLRNSVKASLKKLRTDYIDVLYMHWWDVTTSIEELMQSLVSACGVFALENMRSRIYAEQSGKGGEGSLPWSLRHSSLDCRQG